MKLYIGMGTKSGNFAAYAQLIGFIMIQTRFTPASGMLWTNLDY